MERTHEMFLTALRSALRGEQADMALTGAEWTALLTLARIHKVLPLVFQAVHGSPSLEQMDGQRLALLRQQVKQQVVLQTLRTGEFLVLNRALRAAGVHPLVVKGLVCRALYPHPDHRPSGDEDVLIRREDFEICHRVMTGLGITAGTEDTASYEIPYRKAGSPLYIELHMDLFPPESPAYGDLNRFFEGIHDRAAELILQGATVAAPCHTDHLFYLICHAFKHFLHSGFGIRQVCDIALFARKYGEQVDWQHVYDNCEAIRAVKFAAAVFRIGEKYLGVESPVAFRYVTVDEGPMLEDLLAGGLYGDATLSRKHSSSITLDAVAAKKQGKRPRGAVAVSVFPAVKEMAGKYPYLKEKPWLLPVAWCQRLWRYARETRSTADSSAAEAMKIGADRLELMKTYGILP